MENQTKILGFKADLWCTKLNIVAVDIILNTYLPV